MAIVIVNIAVGAGVLALVVLAYGALRAASRGRGRPLPRLVSVGVFSGLVLIELGIAGETLAHRRFEPARTRLTLNCHTDAAKSNGELPVIGFSYDPTRQCQANTFYEYHDGVLERVIIQIRHRAGRRAYEARRLIYQPSWLEPESRGTFRKSVQDLTAEDYAAVSQITRDHPIVCPAAGDAAARSDMTRVAGALRLALADLHKTPTFETRWDCAPVS